MATAPFNINQALPGDNDIVSQHPGNARSFRDIVESWLLINHDTNGYHSRIDIPRAASPSTPVANVDTLFISTTGRLKIKHPDGTEEYVGVPPGSLSYTSVGSIPNGWLLADGSAISRAAFPDLFIAIGIAYGSGDGTTTFNLPDTKGRFLVNADLGAGRFSTTTMSSTSPGGVGGSQTSALTSVNIPSGVGVSIPDIAVSVSIPSISVSVSGSISGTSTGQTASGAITGLASGGTVSGTGSGTFSGTSSVTSATAQYVKNTGLFLSSTVPTGGTAGIFSDINALSTEGINSSGSASGSVTVSSISASITSNASVSGSFSGAVSAGTVTGSFSGSGTGTGSGSGTGTGTGVTTGSSTGTVFTNMPPTLVQYIMIKT